MKGWALRRSPRKDKKMRKVQDALLWIIGLLLTAMVLWVVERDQLLGYALGVALAGLMFFVIVERVNPTR